jgi:endoglucanase
MSEQLLRALCDAPGVSGWEDAVRDLARAELEPHADEVRVDRLGNLIAVRRASRTSGDAPPLKVMVAAHLDERGFMVKAIDERGFIRVQPVGGFDPRTLVSQASSTPASEPASASIVSTGLPFPTGRSMTCCGTPRATTGSRTR